jgi:hypothetical protein
MNRPAAGEESLYRLSSHEFLVYANAHGMMRDMYEAIVFCDRLQKND